MWASESAPDAAHALPWGTMTGQEVLDAYTHEFTVHVWDLCRATDRDDDLAEAALGWSVRNVPPEERHDGGPFAEPVSVSDDADPYTQLAAYVGRAPSELDDR